MPREFFHDEHDSDTRRGPQVTVGWSREAPQVDVGVIHHVDAVTDALAKLLVEVDITDEQRVEVIVALTHDSSPVFGWHSNLGRSEINRLIRTLRRARDVAFGADA